MILEPFALFFIVGNDFLNLSPKSGRMIHLFSVTKLMNNYVIQDFFWRFHEETIEVKIPLGGAASPAALLHPDGDISIGYAYKTGIESDFPWDDPLSTGF